MHRATLSSLGNIALIWHLGERKRKRRRRGERKSRGEITCESLSTYITFNSRCFLYDRYDIVFYFTSYLPLLLPVSPEQATNTMTVSDIGKIVSTVAIVQLAADLLSRRYIFQSDSYIRSVAQFNRARDRRDKTALAIAAKQQVDPKAAGKKQAPSAKSAEKDQKKLQRENEELSAIAAEVARRHTMSGFYTSITFLFLYKILAAEYAGKVVAVLPFEPFKLLQRLTFMSFGGPSKLGVGEVQTLWLGSLGPDATLSPDVQHVSQACAFAFIYMLCSISVKMMINMAFGTKPPRGADEGMGTFMDSPQSQKMFKTFGLDVDEVKEARNALGF